MFRSLVLATALLTVAAPAWADPAPDPELVRILELAEPVRGFTSFAEPGLATLPAVGFFPLGGDLAGDAPGLRVGSSAFGAGVDLLNLHAEHARVSLLATSAYLVGVSWTQLVATGDTRFVDLAYGRVGPKITVTGVPLVGQLGFQVGYAALLSASPSSRTTGMLHGLDVSVSIPLFSGYQYATELRRRQADIVRERANAATRYLEAQSKKLADLEDRAEQLRREQARIRQDMYQAEQVRKHLRREYEGLSQP